MVVASVIGATWAGIMASSAPGQPPSPPVGPGRTPATAESGAEPAGVREILASSRAYAEAMDRGDGAALAAMWTADGDIVDEQGEVRSGRATAAAVKPLADGTDGPQLRISATAIRLVTPTVGMEDGTVEVQPPGGGPIRRGRFTATWVKQDDGWKLASVRENRFESAGGTGQLADLEWMVGEWDIVDAALPDAPAGAGATEASAASRLRARIRWNSTRTFLIRELRLAAAARGPGGPAGDGAVPGDDFLVVTQRIGWDPASKQIRSWSFGEDGSHGEGVWSKEDGSWFVRTSSVLPDGSTAAAVNVYQFDGGDTCTWQSFPTSPGADAPAPVTATMVRRKAR